jgi:hypothetical protein
VYFNVIYYLFKLNIYLSFKNKINLIKNTIIIINNYLKNIINGIKTTFRRVVLKSKFFKRIISFRKSDS